MGKYKLHGGSHTTPDGKKVYRGETWNPTDSEKEQNKNRITRAQSVFMCPGIPGLDEDESEED